MRNKYANHSAPKLPRCFGCARPMQLVRTPRFGELRDVYTFGCPACDVWHIEEADALEGRPADRDGSGSLAPAPTASRQPGSMDKAWSF